MFSLNSAIDSALSNNASGITVTMNGVDYTGLNLTGLETIHAPCEFIVRLLSTENAGIENVLNQQVTLQWVNNNGISRVLQLYVGEVRYLQATAQQEAVIELGLTAHWGLLRHLQAPHLLPNQSVVDVARTLLTQQGYAASDLVLHLSQEYPVRPMSLEIEHESALDFLQRLLASEGISLVSEWDESGNETLYLIDNQQGFLQNNTELSFNPHRGLSVVGENDTNTVFSIERLDTVRTSSVMAHDSHAEVSPRIIPSAQHGEDDDKAVRHHFGTHSLAPNSPMWHAKIRQQIEQSQSALITAVTDSLAIQAGELISISHPSLNNDYLVTAIQHELDVTGKNTGTLQRQSYRNTLTLTPAIIAYRPAIPATVTNPTTLLASIAASTPLDPEGKMPVTPYAVDNSTHNLRRLQPYGGGLQHPDVDQVHGLHTPLTDEVDVVLGFLNTDFDRPYIMGSLPHSETKSVVTSANSQQHIIKTVGNNQLSFDDQTATPAFEAQTPNAQNQLQMQNGESPQLTFASNQGSVLLQAEQVLTVQSGANRSTQVTNDYLETVNANMNRNVNGSSTEISQANLFHIAQNNIVLNAKQNVEMTTQTHLTINAKQDINYNAQNGVSLVSNAGNVVVSANDTLCIQGQGNGSLQISQAGGGITLDAQGNVSFYGASAIAMTASNNIVMQGKVSFKDSASSMPAAPSVNPVTPQVAPPTPPTPAPAAASAGASSAAASSASTTPTNNGNANNANASSTNNSQSTANSPATAASQQPYPTLSFDLGSLGEMDGTHGPFYYKASLSNSVTLQKQGTYSAGEFSLEGYKLEAKSTLQGFFSNLTITKQGDKQVTLGSKVTGDFVSTSVEPIFNGFHFESAPQPLSKEFGNWNIEGNLAFSLDLIKQDKSELSASENAKESLYELGVGEAILIGSLILSAIEDLALALLVVAI